MNKITQTKQKIASILKGQFLKEIHYEGNDLAVITKLGGIDTNLLGSLELNGFTLRYINPVVIEGRKGLVISLEVA